MLQNNGFYKVSEMFLRTAKMQSVLELHVSLCPKAPEPVLHLPRFIPPSFDWRSLVDGNSAVFCSSFPITVSS